MATSLPGFPGGFSLSSLSAVDAAFAPGQVPSDIRILWDLDGDGDFSEPEEDITEFVTSAQVVYGRDSASQLGGQVSPGKFKASLTNTDGRFTYFNANSPLNQTPFSLRSGSLIRVQKTTTTGTDPKIISSDDFIGAGVGQTDQGLTWVGADDVQVVAGGAFSNLPFAFMRADVGTLSEFYLQVQIKQLGCDSGFYLPMGWNPADNTFHSVYVVSDTSETTNIYYSTGGTLTPGAGVVGSTLLFVAPVDNIDGRYLGAHVHGSTIDFYIDGCLIGSKTVGANTGTYYGIYFTSIPDDTEVVGNWRIWDKRPSTIDGVIWTGRVETCQPSTSSHQNKTAEISAFGPLASLAAADIETMASIGKNSGVSAGVTAGQYVGNACLRAGLGLTGPITSDVTMGAFTNEQIKALDACRRAEAVEFGRLYETPEGYIGFASRTLRDTGTLFSSWSDVNGASIFAYNNIDLNDWRGDVINRVTSGVAPSLPRFKAGVATSGNTAVGVNLPSSLTLNSSTIYSIATPGDLILGVFWGSNTTVGEEWLEPTGWVNVRGDRDGGDGKIKIYAKVLKQDDIDTHVDTVFYNDSSNAGGAFYSFTILIGDFYGSIADGLHVSSTGFAKPAMTAAANNGTLTLDAVSPPWGGTATLHWRFKAGVDTSTRGTSKTPSTLALNQLPYRFNNQNAFTQAATVRSNDICMLRALRNSTLSRLPETKFAADVLGFDYIEDIDLMIRGYTGTGTDKQFLTVTTDDATAQKRVNSIKSYELPGTAFQTVVEAQAYNQAVLNKYSTEKPTFSINFSATKSAAYMSQATNRRIGDRIFLDTTGNSSLGIKGQYVIESISHNWSHGDKNWQVVWQLGPV